jgi:hypothetical protein
MFGARGANRAAGNDGLFPAARPIPFGAVEREGHAGGMPRRDTADPAAALPPLRAAAGPHLAAAAALERDTRERNYPDLVKAGKLTAEQADGDLAAWRTIAEILERGFTMRETSWSELHLYTSRCLQALERDVERAQADGSPKLARLLDRRADVAAIHHLVDRHKFLIDDTNRILRARAGQQEKAA